MKKVIAINGSPRKKYNTATLLQYALAGAESVGAETEMIHLYDLNYKGCISCFACKRKDGKFKGKCAVKDELSSVLDKIMASNAVIFGSPIYLGDITGEMRSLLERLFFMNLSYEKAGATVFNGSIHVGFIYTMNLNEKEMKEREYEYLFASHIKYAKLLGGNVTYMTVTDTYQFNDYSKYAADRFDEEHKRIVKETRFPIDCRNAFEMGVSLTK